MAAMVFVATGCAASQPVSSDSAALLFGTINARLALMAAVAAYKRLNNLPVEEKEQEVLVLAAAAARATDAGLQPESVEDFFVAQMAAGKAVQYRYLADWESRPAPDTAADLNRETRPQLLELGSQIVDELVDVLEQGPITEADRAAFDKAVTAPQVAQADRDALFAGLLEVRLQPPAA